MHRRVGLRWHLSAQQLNSDRSPTALRELQVVYRRSAFDAAYKTLYARAGNGTELGGSGWSRRYMLSIFDSNGRAALPHRCQ